MGRNVFSDRINRSSLRLWRDCSGFCRIGTYLVRRVYYTFYHSCINARDAWQITIGLKGYNKV